MAPRSSERGQLTPSRWAATPTSAAMHSTPSVASTAEGASTGRAAAKVVLSPPSKRISTSAAVPTRYANW
jgi:hypothetical protein